MLLTDLAGCYQRKGEGGGGRGGGMVLGYHAFN